MHVIAYTVLYRETEGESGDRGQALYTLLAGGYTTNAESKSLLLCPCKQDS